MLHKLSPGVYPDPPKRPVRELFPYAWLYFVPSIQIATLTMLDLCIAVIVTAMPAQHNVELERTEAAENAKISFGRSKRLHLVVEFDA